MSRRQLPSIEATARLRQAAGCEPPPAALARWNAAIQAAASDDATISILDVIGADWTGEGVTSRRIAAALRAIGKRDIVVNVNSPGGDFFEGLAIYNMLREHEGEVTVKVLGMAASAASLIAMAGDRVEIARAGFLMIHNTWAVAIGNRHDMRDFADTLEQFDAAATSVYAARTGLEAKAIGKMMDADTFIAGENAVEQGFADDLLPSDAVADDPKALAERPVMQRLAIVLAAAGMPRAERRAMIKEILDGTPRAAGSDGTPRAADDAAKSYTPAALERLAAIVADLRAYFGK